SLTDTGAPLGYRAARIRMRALLPSTSRRTDIPEADMPPRKRACLTTLAPEFEIGESSAAGPEHPPSPDYVPDPEHPPPPVEIPYVPEPEYPELCADSDPEEDLEEDPEDDQADYPADGGDGDDEPSNDDDDDDDTDDEDLEDEPFEEDDMEEDEHLALADSSAVPIVDPVLPTRETKALKADEPTHAPGSPIIILFSQTHLRMARKTVRPEPPMSASMEACITR
nr:hypothetical protein [Tanacetum cinerariifolium]